MKLNINQLLEKYWNAEASLQEEAELRSYFSGSDVAPEHEQYKDLFTFFSVSRLQSTDLDVEEVMSSLSDIDAILEKYWNAETSLDEEAQLRAYFTGDEVASKHEQFKDMFTFFEVSGSRKSDLDLSSILRDTEGIDEILERYWNAESTLEEEDILKSYFKSNNVEGRHLPYREMFVMFDEKASISTDLNIADVLRKVENEVGENVIGSSTMPKKVGTKVFSLQRWASGIAAVFILGFATVFLMNQPSTTTQYKGQTTYLDEEAEAQEAYEITKEALAFLSSKMNKNSKTVVKSVSKAEKASIFK